MAHTGSYKRILTRLGYYDYQQGLIYRHLGQDSGWDSHLENCRKFILRAVEIYKPEKVSVIGSGWLLDLPLSEMVEKVNTVVLYDIVHPPQVREQVAGFNNVKLEEVDATGGLIAEVWAKTGAGSIFKKPQPIDEINIPFFNLPGDSGLVISLNILSQLDVLPLQLIKRKSTLSDKQIHNFRSAVQQNHIDFLRQHPAVLISDVKEIFTEKSGKVSEYQSVVVNIPAGKLNEKWTWNFDLKKSDYFEKRSVFKVEAVVL